MEMTWAYINLTFDPRDMLLFLQIVFRFVRAVVAYAIFARVSGSEPSSATRPQRYLKLFTTSSFCPLSLNVIDTVCPQFDLLLLLLCSHSPNDAPPEPQRNVSIAAVRGAVRPSNSLVFSARIYILYIV